jgi:hypothetical protein
VLQPASSIIALMSLGPQTWLAWQWVRLAAYPACWIWPRSRLPPRRGFFVYETSYFVAIVSVKWKVMYPLDPVLTRTKYYYYHIHGD